MRFYLTVFITKIFILLLRMLGRGATSAPGKLAFKLYPDILKEYQGRVKKEIIAVMGTNGKTTTNNLLCDCLEKAGEKVVCNRIGANMDEGSLVAFINKTTIFGKTDIDYACLEMDEGWAEYILNYITPHKIIVTNLFRDQLDRYGEIDITIDFLRKAVRKAPDAVLILNADDPLTVFMASEFNNQKVYFGIKNSFKEYNSHIKEGKYCYNCGRPLKYNFYHYSQLGDYYCECGFRRPEIDFNAQNITVFPELTFDISSLGRVDLKIRGMYNIYNILASAAAAHLCGIDFKYIQAAAADYRPQTGRMELFNINGKPVYLILAKNPAGFNQSAYSAAEDTRSKDILIAINDNIQDGTDVSWLWDVDFESIMNDDVLSYTVCGKRYADMGLRLKYAGVDINKIHLSDDIRKSLKTLIESGNGDVLYVLVNYTALFSTNKILRELQNGN